MKRLFAAAFVFLAAAGSARAQFEPTDSAKYPNLLQPLMFAPPPDLPDVAECRGVISQIVLDLVNSVDRDPAETFEQNRREHPHMVMMPPPLECASKLFRALRRGPRLTGNAAVEPEGTDAISLRQYPADAVFNPLPLAASVGANVDPANGVEGYQGENNIAINPNNPQQIIAHSNTFYRDPNPNCQSPTGGSANTYGTMALFGSTDGGATWTYNCAPWPASASGGVSGAVFWFGSDPALAWDAQGRAYACYMLISQNSTGSNFGASIVVARSTNVGASWSSLGTVVSGITLATGNGSGNDKQMMAIDNTTGQAFSHPGRIYVIWDNCSATACNLEKLAYSDDGVSWTTVSLPNNTGAIGGNVVVGADGTVYVVWNRYNLENVVFSKSTDGGATWTTPIVIATTALQSFGSNNLPPAQDQRGINAFASIDIDRNPSSAFFGKLYVSFTDFPAGTTTGPDLNVYIVTSTNGGTSWSSRVKVNDDNFGASQFFPWLAVDQSDGTVNVSWYDSRLDPLNRKTQMVYARSSNGGASFEPNILITDSGANFRNGVNYADENSADNTTYNGNQYGDYSGIAALNRQVHPLWTDSRMFFPLADTQSPTRREDNATSAIINCSAPSAVAAPGVNSTTTPSVVVSWTAPAGWGTNATGGTYSVYRATTPVFPGGSPLASNLTSTSYVDITGTLSTTYFYFVRAKNNCPGTALTPMTTDSPASAGVVFGSAGTAVGTLQGTVTSAGNLVSGATVTAGALSATTNGSGFYQFSAIGVGTYTVSASASGYNNASVNGVAVSSGATTVQNLSLTPTTANACFTDTTFNDFSTGSGTSVDITTSPGNVRLALTGSEAIDQNSAPASLFATNNITSTQWIGQTFRAGASGNLTKITLDLGLASGGTSGTITLEVRNISGTQPGTTVLASTTVGPITNVGSAANYQATFASPAAVVSGTSYSIVLKANTGSTAFGVRGNTSSLANGQWFLTTNSGGAWTAQAQDLFFATYVTPTTLQSSGNLVSSVKDSGAVTGSSATWTTLSWTATTPANTTVRFQIAASSSASGPFNFVGPDGTAATFFTTSGASLSQFNGKRYLQYKAYLSTTDTAVTPTLNDVTVCEQVVDCTSAVPTVTPGAAQACASSTGNTASGPAGMSTYSWSLTNGTITGGASAQTVTYTAGASGSVGLTLTITNSSGCQAIGSASVPIVAAPSTPVISGPTSACSGTQVQYTATSTGATSFQWFRGATLLGETSSTLTIASVAAGDAGTYTARGVNACGTSAASNAIALAVSSAPASPSISGPSTACPGTQVQYTATSAGATSFQWYRGATLLGETSATLTIASAAAGDAGTYTAYGVNSCGTSPVSNSITLTINPAAPASTSIGGPSSACSGTQVQYTATSAGATSFQWFRGATLLAETSSTLTIPAVAAGDAGTYTAYGVNSCGTSPVSNSIALTVNTVPAAPTISGPSTACSGTQVQYIATSTGATSFQWFRGATLLAETSATLTIASVAAGDAGTYTAYGVNSCGTSSVSNSIALTVNSVPSAPAISGPSTACPGTQVQYTATSSGATSFQWYRGATLLAETSSTLTIASVAAGDAGTYTAYGVNSCGTSPVSNSIALTVNPAAPTSTTISGPAVACTGAQVQYTATSSGATSFQWYRGATLLAETSSTLTIASASGADAGTYTAYGVNSCGTSPVSNSIPLTINSAPASVSIAGPSTACPGTQVQYFATAVGATSYQWYRGATLLAETSATLTIASVAAGDAGTYTAYAVNACGNSPVSNSIALTVNPAAPASTTISGPSSACSGSQVQYTATSANATSFQWYRGATLLAETSSTLTIPAVAANDAGTYTAYGVNSCGTSPVSNAIALIVDTVPAAPTISGPSTACAGTQVQYTASSSGATSFQWYRGATLLAETSATLTIASVAAGDAGTYTAYGVNSCGTSSVSNSIALTVNTVPSAPTISGPSTACPGTQVQYTATSTGATSFQWYRGATLLAETSSTLTIASAAAGDAGTYTAYGVNSCGTSSVSNSITLTLNAAAPTTASISGPSTACPGTQVQYTATSANATSFQWYRGATLLAETSATLTIASAAAGDAGTYTAYGVNSCGTSSVSNSITLTLNAAAPTTASISGPSTACPGTQVQYTATSANATSFQWYRDATLLAETSATLTIASAAAGDAGTYTAYGVNSCGTSSVSNSITLALNAAAPTTASISGPSTACPGTQVQYTATSANATSFQWYRGATLLAETSATLTIASAAAGDAGTYTAYGVNSCGTSSVSNSITLTLNAAAPTTASISGPSNACAGTQVQYTATSANATSFQWYRGATLLSETSSTLTIASVAAGDAGTYTAYGVNSCGTSSVSNAIALTVNNVPSAPTISGPSTACPGTQVQYTATSTGATSFQWYRGATLLAETSSTLTIASAAAGDAGTYTAYGVNSCGTSSVSNSITLTLNAAAPTTASISGPSTACPGTQVQYTATSANATSFQWYRGATLLAETSSTLTIASAAAGDAGTYTAYGVNSCGTSSVSSSITLTLNAAAPTTASISGPSSACPGTQVQYTATSAGATSFQWYRGATLLAETSSTLTIASAAAGDAGTYTAYGVNSCGTSSVSNSITLTLNAGAPTTASISGPSTACPGTQVQYTATSANATSFQWYRGATLLAETSATLTIASAAAGDAGTYTAYGVNSCGTSSVSNSITLTLNAAAPASTTISGPSTACAGTQVQYTATSANATSFQWYRGATLLAETSATLTIASASAGDAGTYTAYGVNSCGTSPVSNSITLALNAAAPSAPTISGATTSCGTAVTLTANPAGAGTYQWYLGGNPINQANASTYLAAQSGSYTVTVSNSCGTSSPSAAHVLTIHSVPAQPTITPGGPTTFCAGGSVTLTSSSAGGNQWFLNGSPINTATSQQYVATASGNYTVVVTSNGCSSSPSAATAVTVNPIPNATITAPSTLASGASGAASVADAGAGATYNWSITGGSITSGAGTRTITFTAGPAGTLTLNVTVTRSGCSDAKSANVAVTAPHFDPNNDGQIDPADIFYLVAYLFTGGPAPQGPGGMLSGDANGDGLVDPADIFYIVHYLFSGGPAPLAVTPPGLRPASTPAAGALSGSISLGRPIARGGRYVVPVIVTAAAKSTPPQAIALKVRFDRDVDGVSIARAGAVSRLQPAFEVSRATARELSWLASFRDLPSGVVAEIELPSLAEVVRIEIEPSVTMLANAAGTEKATVANGSLTIGRAVTAAPREKPEETPRREERRQ